MAVRIVGRYSRVPGRSRVLREDLEGSMVFRRRGVINWPGRMSLRPSCLAVLALCACNERTLPESSASVGESSTTGSSTGEPAASTGVVEASTGDASSGTPTTGAPPAPSTCGDGHVDVGEVCLGEPVLIDSAPAEQLATADVDGDGRIDLLTENGLWLQRDGGFEAGVLPALAARWRGFGDFDGDGLVDLYYCDYDERFVGLSRGDGLGGFAEPVVTEVSQLSRPLAIDVDGDGRTELVAQAAELEALRIYVAADDLQVMPLAIQPMSMWAHVRDVGDGDGDGVPDLMIVDGGTPRIWWGLGDGSFATPKEYLPTVADIRFADIEGDGVDEFMFSDSVYPPWQPDKHWAGVMWPIGEQSEWPVASVQIDVGGSELAAGDFSGDGLADVSVAIRLDVGGWALAVLCSAPERTLVACAHADMGLPVNKLAPLHANADGALDLVIAGDDGLWVIPADP